MDPACGRIAENHQEGVGVAHIDGKHVVAGIALDDGDRACRHAVHYEVVVIAVAQDLNRSGADLSLDLDRASHARVGVRVIAADNHIPRCVDHGAPHDPDVITCP